MLKPEDRDAIEGLFERLEAVERRGGDRDPDAEDLIQRSINRQPGAPYYMAQTILVQEHALGVAEERIAELERQLQARSRDERGLAPRGPWGNAPRDEYGDSRQAGRGFGGGGFLAGAAQTAMGVAGGVLLGQAIGSLFGGGEAQAAEAPTEPPAPPDTDPGDDGGDFGGFDGFDTGGDF